MPPSTSLGLRSCVVALLLAAAPASARVSEEEASRLGGPELTPLGAERAGNAAGTIPAWTGGIREPPSDYVPGRHHPDPFASDEVRFTITAANLEQHAEHLSEGQRALLLTYPDSWRMPVYPTRRSASFPEFVYEAVRQNATSAELIVEGRGGVRHSRVASPFPLPRSGVEVVWNHSLRWRGIRVKRSEGIAAVTRSGRFRVTLNLQDFAFAYGSPSDTAFQRAHPNVLFGLRSKVISPALLSGRGFLAIETINQTGDPRKVWLYSRDLRRVFRSPLAAYDDPAFDADGLRTIDEFGLYNGAPDRYDWELLGKREIYVPYNAYRLHSHSVGPRDIVRQGHIEPALARYELHRVWVVQGTLKPGKSHVYAKRVFYVDEDSWQIAVAESYDREGRLWRVAEAHALNYYEVPVLWTTLEVFHDLIERRFLVNGLDNERNAYRFEEGGDPREFSPNALLYYVR